MSDEIITKTVIDLMRDMHTQNMQILTHVTEVKGDIKTINQRLQYSEEHMKRTDDKVKELSTSITNHAHPCMSENNCSDPIKPLLQIPIKWKKLVSYIVYGVLAASALFFGVLEHFTKASENEKPKITLIKGEKDK